MSYILDALKKAEQEHQRRRGPRLDAGPLAGAGEPKRRPRGPYLIGFALLLNAALLVWWVRPWQAAVPAKAPAAGPAKTAIEASKPSQSAAAPTPLEAVSPPAPAAVASAPAARPAAKPAPTPPAEMKSEVPRAPEKPSSPLAEAEPEAGVPKIRKPPAPQRPDSLAKTAPGASARAKQAIRQEKAADDIEKPLPAGRQTASRELVMDLKALTGSATPSEKAAASRKAVRYYELPSSIRDAMPRLSVSMLFYSKDAANRTITVNGAKLREGQEVSAALKLEEITPDGAVFNYKGHRFYKPVIGD